MARDPSDGAIESQLGTAASEPPAQGWATVDKTVFGISAGIIVAICVLGVLFTDTVEAAAVTALGWVTGNLGWLFILSATGFVAFALVLAFGRYGGIPLSREARLPNSPPCPGWP